VAAALARVAAEAGRRVLVAEVATDADAPSPVVEMLGGRRSGDEPVQVLPNLRAVLLTPAAGHRRFLHDTLPVHFLADAAMRSSAIRRFLGAAPAFAEMGVLYRILTLLQARRPDGSLEHEVAVIDLPATGHALALTQLPEVLLKIIPGGPIVSALREGLAIFNDPALTATLVVTLPETLPVSEALELSAGLVRHHVPLCALVANRVPVDPFTADERAAVDRVNAHEGPLFGSRAVRRLDRARHAVGRLRQAASAPVLIIPELSQRGRELVEAVAGRVGRSLAGAEASP